MLDQFAHSLNVKDEKYMHISFDDVYLCLYDISANEYRSVFENSFFADLKNLHDAYGVVFTLICFNTHSVESGYDISNLPERYAKELSSCSYWLKFAFHAENEITVYNVDNTKQIKESYDKFIKAVLKATKTADSIDTVTRLGFFAGTLSNIKALKECDYGITGLLTADDTRLSYYFSDSFNRKIIEETICYDTENALKLIRSQTRLESISDPISTLEGLLSYDKSMMEIFTHEMCYRGNVPNIMKTSIEWAISNHYKFGYAQGKL